MENNEPCVLSEAKDLCGPVCDLEWKFFQEHMRTFYFKIINKREIMCHLEMKTSLEERPVLLQVQVEAMIEGTILFSASLKYWYCLKYKSDPKSTGINEVFLISFGSSPDPTVRPRIQITRVSHCHYWRGENSPSALDRLHFHLQLLKFDVDLREKRKRSEVRSSLKGDRGRKWFKTHWLNFIIAVL